MFCSLSSWLAGFEMGSEALATPKKEPNSDQAATVVISRGASLRAGVAERE